MGLGAWLLMAIAFWPTLRFYGRSPVWTLLLPLIRSVLPRCNSPLRCPLLGRSRRSMERTYPGPSASLRPSNPRSRFRPYGREHVGVFATDESQVEIGHSFFDCRFDPRAIPEQTNYFWGTASSALAPRLDQGQQSNRLPTPRAIASVKVMRIPCSGRKITIGRASIVWPGTRRKSYFLSRTLRIMRICSMA